MSLIITLRRWIYHLPGKRFGFYRAIPIFLISGAGIEYLMINWHPFGVNFYEVYKQKEAKRIAAERIKDES